MARGVATDPHDLDAWEDPWDSDAWEDEDAEVDPFDPETWTEVERLYFEYVDEMLSSRVNVGISNGKPSHAVYLLAAFLRNASRSVRLFSGAMKRKTTDGNLGIYDNRHVSEAAEILLSQPDSRLIVVLENDIDVDDRQEVKDHPLVRSIMNLQKSGKLEGLFEVRKIMSDRLEWLRAKGICYHLMLMDEQAYRLETDPESMKAQVNFGDPKTAQILANLFDRFICRDSEKLLTVSASAV